MMTQAEWTYLLNSRSVSHARYHFATVSEVNGVILYPDAYTPSSAGAPTVSSGGTVTADNWRKMQLQGCVFLSTIQETNVNPQQYWLPSTRRMNNMNWGETLYIKFNQSITVGYTSQSSTFPARLVHNL